MSHGRVSSARESIRHHAISILAALLLGLIGPEAGAQTNGISGTVEADAEIIPQPPGIGVLVADAGASDRGRSGSPERGLRRGGRAAPREEAWGPRGDGADADRFAEPYRMPGGYYVIPDESGYRPDWSSPRIRRFPDHGPRATAGPGRQDSIRDRRLQDGFVPYWTAPGPVYAPGCGAAGWGGYSPYGAIDAYEQGRYDADHEYIWHIASQRAGLLLDQHAEMFDEGLIEFREGRYDRALLNMIGAAEKNHTSAAARLHAAHALFALGRYSEARDYLARAFELKPGLEHKMFDLRDEYGDPTLFDGQLARLRQHVGKHPNDAAALTVLGYAYYYTRGPGSARGALERAARLDPDSFFIPKLLRLARMTSGIQPNSSPSAIAGRPRQSESAPAAIESRRPAGTIRRVRADGVVERL